MLTSNQLELHDFFYNNSSLAYFIKVRKIKIFVFLFENYLIQFAEEEKITDLIRFWIDVEHFYQSIINRNIPNQTLADNALAIYNQ